MVEASWALFVVASLLLIVTPGQDMILVMSRAITNGTHAGLATAAGVSVGLVGHTLLATAGLGVLLQASAWLFTVIKLAGAAYLLYLGVQLLRTLERELALRGGWAPLQPSQRPGSAGDVLKAYFRRPTDLLVQRWLAMVGE